ncbi:MAK10-like protein [Tanacetum coccineum]
MHIPWNLVRGSKPTYQGFIKLVDSLDLDVANRERTRLRLFQFFLRDQASKWLERLPAGSISTWEDLTTRFLAQFFPPRRTAKLRNDILMFQQHQGESLSEAWTRFKDLLQKVPHHGINLWLQVQIFYDHVNPTIRQTIYQSASVNKISSSCEICSGPHDTQYCMENLKQAFVEYASSHTDEAGDKYMESLELGKHGSAFIQGEMPKSMEDPRLFTLPCRLGDSKPFDTLADLGSCLNIFPLYLFKKLKLGLLEEIDHVFGLADGTKSYLVGLLEMLKSTLED